MMSQNMCSTPHLSAILSSICFNSSAAAPVERHRRAAGRRHEHAHAAGRQCLAEAAAHRARSGQRARQEDRPGDARPLVRDGDRVLIRPGRSARQPADLLFNGWSADRRAS